MSTKLITLIQFHSGIDLTGGNADVKIRTTYYLNDEDDSYEFYLGEDDNGDEQYDNRSAISVFDCIDDLLAEEFHYFVSGDDLLYSTIEIEVETDENGKPIWKAA